MRFKKSSYIVRDGQTPSLWDVAEQHQKAVAQSHQTKAHHQTLLNQTRHDSRNWVSSAKRFIEGNQPDQAMACLDVLNNWLDRPLHSSRLGLRRQMESACVSWRAQCHRCVELIIRVSPAIKESNIQNELILSVLDNLIRNALRATDRGAVRCMLWNNGRDTVLRVSDTGGGLSGKTHGWGMGLSLIEQRIRAVGGSIQLENHPGVGVSVTARFNADRYSPSN